MSPYKSVDLTIIVEADGEEFVVPWSPETAEHELSYCELGSFPTREQAEKFVASGTTQTDDSVEGSQFLRFKVDCDGHI